MSGQASVSTETRQNALTVPLQAVTVRTEKQLATPTASRKDLPDGGAPEPAPLPGPGARKSTKGLQQKVVFVVEDGKARVRRVETGLASENEIEILSGLQEGEPVVEGPYKVLSRELSDGRAVKLDKTSEKAGAKGS